MKEFVTQLFSEKNSSLQISLFDIWHFLYLFIIFGGTTLLAFLFCKSSVRKKDTVLRLFAYLTVGLYIADFFIMPLSDSYSGISVYKLPFNICTLMAVLVPFTEFNPRFAKIKKTVAVLGLTASTMWMVYPGTALGGQPPFCYIIFQTFMYHGFLYTWGFLNMAFGRIKLEWRTFWQDFVGVLIILVWADLGNTIYGREQNWFFIESSIFPFLPDKIMPLAVVFSVTGSAFVVHGIYYLVKTIVTRQKAVKGQ
jgi:hypothetical protein